MTHGPKKKIHCDFAMFSIITKLWRSCIDTKLEWSVPQQGLKSDIDIRNVYQYIFMVNRLGFLQYNVYKTGNFYVD